jgi:hypothetical protein
MLRDEVSTQIFMENCMKNYNGVAVTEDFYTFFAPYFLDLIAHISDPREQDNYNLRYSLSSYLSVIVLGLCQGATSMRQIVLLSKDEAFQERADFLFAGGKVAQSQNAFTNLVEQLDPQEFQQRYNTMLHALSHAGALQSFAVQGLRIAALDGIELHNHLYAERQHGTSCPYCLTRTHKKGTPQEYVEWFHRTVVLTLVGQPGSIFCAQEPQQCRQDGADKGSEKKAAKRLLQRAAEQHLLDLIDVLVCDALYADADFIATVQSYDIIPVIRIKQEHYNIMKEVDDFGQYISFSQAEEDDERKMSYRYRVFEHLYSWKMYKGALCIVEIHEQLSDGKMQQARWVFPQEYAEHLVSAVVREIGHLRWQEEINEFKLANQHLNIKHMLHHEPHAIQIFLFLKLFVLTFFSLFVAQSEPRLQKKRFL